MKKSDLLWTLAYPIYQIVGTLRHEASHALVVLAQGGEILEFTFWPTKDGYWGYTQWQGASTSASGAIAIDAAPYLVDALTFLIFFSICMIVTFKWRWVWVNLIAFGIISPLVNSAYNYWVGVRTNRYDVGDLMAAISPPIVHTYFWITLTAYLIGLVLVFTISKMASRTRAQNT